LEGKEEKAVRLAERYLDLAWVKGVARFPGDGADTMAFESALYALAGDRRMSQAGLERLANALDRQRLGAEQVRELRMAQMERVLKGMRHVDRSGAYGKLNTWHFLQDGKVEAWVSGLVQPIWRMQLEQAAAAWEEEDYKKLVALEIQMMGTRWVQNHKVSFADVVLSSTDPVSGVKDNTNDGLARVRGEFVNSELHFARLLLAAGRFRRDMGRLPRSVAELAPRYLDIKGLNTERDAWQVYALGERPVVCWFHLRGRRSEGVVSVLAQVRVPRECVAEVDKAVEKAKGETMSAKSGMRGDE
jgi:hypothetical protein